MNAAYIRIWNSTIKPEDYVYYLGDFAFAGTQKIAAIVEQLHGTKFLIRGNHDAKISDNRWLELGMQEVHSQLVLEYRGTKLLLCHFPYISESVVEDARYLNLRPADAGITLLHGHRHSSYAERIRLTPKGTVMYDCGIDAHGKPLSIDEVLFDIKSYISNAGYRTNSRENRT